MNFEKLINPETSSFNCFLRRDKEFNFNWHYHPECELVLIVKSKGKRHVGDKIEDYSNGDLILIGPNLPHTWKSEAKQSNHTAIVVHFHSTFLGKDFLNHPETKRIRVLLDQALWGIQFDSSAISSDIEKLPTLTGFDQTLAFLGILHRLSHLQARQTISTRNFTDFLVNRDQTRIENVFNFINTNYHKKIKQEHVSRMAHMSTSHFCQFFKKATGLTFVTYLNNIRISKACSLLKDTDMPVIEVCLECGFENLSNFNRQFRNRKQMSPRNYRSLTQTDRLKEF